MTQDFFDLAIFDKNRQQVHQELAALAASSAGVSKKAVLEQLAFPSGDPHPGTNISKVRPDSKCHLSLMSVERQEGTSLCLGVLI